MRAVRAARRTFVFSIELAEESLVKWHDRGHAGSHDRDADFKAAPNDSVKNIV